MSLALARMGLGQSPSACVSCVETNSDDSSQCVVDVETYQQIPIPVDGTMYHHLMQRAKEVVAIGQRSPAAYRRTMMGLNNLLANGDDVVAPSGAGILAPVPKKIVKRGRPTNADLMNLSALKKQTPSVLGNKKTRACKTCKKNGKNRTDHRTGRKCPFLLR